MAQILTTQPFPFTHYSYETGGYVPCGEAGSYNIRGTPLQMMRAYWRVKKYRVNFSFTTSAPYPITTESCVLDLVSSKSIDSLIPTTNESQLVCGTYLYQNIISKTDHITDVNAFFSFGKADYYFNSDPNQSLVYLYFKNFLFDNTNDDYPDWNTQTGGSLGEVIFDGFQVYLGDEPLYYNAVDIGISAFSASIVASELWPYEA
jgi:hypothetical protein